MPACLIVPCNHLIQPMRNVREKAFIKAEITFDLDTISMCFWSNFIFNNNTVAARNFSDNHIQLAAFAAEFKRHDFTLGNQRIMVSREPLMQYL
ncbi:hypothetical protein HA44_00840 [Mixta gaviniae]|nr:hypothetical protein HA44_00840 [Mixta gaviniae]